MSSDTECACGASIGLRLECLLRGLPAEALVPVGWLRAGLGATDVLPDHPAHLSASQFGAQQPKPRGAEWARRMARAGRVRGVLKVGGDWLFPKGAVVEEARLARRRKAHFVPLERKDAA